MEVLNSREELRVNESGGISDPQVSEESMSVVKSFSSINLGDEDRPAKRRKTLPDASEDINHSTYRQLVIALNGSTQESPVLNLSNLHSTIQ